MAGCFPQVSKKKFGKRGIDASRRFMWLCSIGFLINAILIKKWSKLTASLVYEDDVGCLYRKASQTRNKKASGEYREAFKQGECRSGFFNILSK